MADRSGTEITEYHSYMYAESHGTRYKKTTIALAQMTFYTMTTFNTFFLFRSESRPSFGHMTDEPEDF